MRLSSDAEKLIQLIYFDFKNKRDSGISKDKAKALGGSINIHKNIVPDWIFEDVDETCRELDRAGMMKCFYADNIVYNSWLTDNAIIKMENRVKDSISSVIDTISKLKP